jgi:hypothetical protein
LAKSESACLADECVLWGRLSMLQSINRSTLVTLKGTITTSVMDNMFLPKKRNSFAKPIKALGQTQANQSSDSEFKPPQDVAEQEIAQEDAIDNKGDSKESSEQSGKTAKKGGTFDWFRRMSLKKKLLIFVPIGIVLVAGSAVGAWALTRKKPVPVVQKAPVPVVQKIEEPPKPTTVASTLTGIQITPELNQRGVTGIMIENSIDARPQSGLLDAGIVYEAIAEGGITRFLALFQEAQPDYIGPVRSARPYYINWLKPYGAAYAHVGGSPEALQMINDQKIRDLNEYANSAAYERISSRYAPHNAYTSMGKLDEARVKNKLDAPTFTGFTRKPEAASKAATATTIDFSISSAAFNVHYDYDAATNTYKRSEGGKPHTDDRSKTQLSPKVVIALMCSYSIHPDNIHSVYQTIGSGKATIFQDGTFIDATWTKPTIDDQLSFTDAAGAKIALNAGQTWITALGLVSQMSHTAPVAGATP